MEATPVILIFTPLSHSLIHYLCQGSHGEWKALHAEVLGVFKNIMYLSLNVNNFC